MSKNYQILETLRLKYAIIQFIRESDDQDHKYQARQIKRQLNQHLREVKV